MQKRQIWIEGWFNVLFGKYKEAKKNSTLKTKRRKKYPSALFGYNGLMGMVSQVRRSDKALDF